MNQKKSIIRCGPLSYYHSKSNEKKITSKSGPEIGRRTGTDFFVFWAPCTTVVDINTSQRLFQQMQTRFMPCEGPTGPSAISTLWNNQSLTVCVCTNEVTVYWVLSKVMWLGWGVENDSSVYGLFRISWTKLKVLFERTQARWVYDDVHHTVCLTSPPDGRHRRLRLFVLRGLDFDWAWVRRQASRCSNWKWRWPDSNYWWWSGGKSRWLIVERC
jgi:hypothetical protein